MSQKRQALLLTDEEYLGTKQYEELFVIRIYEVRDKRSTNERGKRSSIKIEKNWTENGALWNSAGKRG